MRRRTASVIPWPYQPRLSAEHGLTMFHSGGEGLAWIRILTSDGLQVTSIDPALIATSRLLIEQRESETA